MEVFSRLIPKPKTDLPVSCVRATLEKNSVREARPENVDGEFYVDHTCIDCDTCRWIAPEFYGRVGSQSAMTAQPQSQEDRILSFQALLSCPTHSIHSHGDKGDLKAAVQRYPEPVKSAEGVYYCGYNSEKSYGGSAWLIVRKEGNVMIDSPRFDPKLVKRIKDLGGVQYIFLTHRDDVADHALWAKEFGAQRVIHASECNSQQGTDKCEIKLEGKGPWEFPGNAEDLKIIHTPGHTFGHCVLLHKPSKALFSGDHLAFSREPPGQLRIFKDYNWYSVPEQIESVRKLLHYDFLHVLPGHGRPRSIKDAAHRLQLIHDLLEHEGAL
ncbi:g3170 [Coccomyxa elongata]